MRESFGQRLQRLRNDRGVSRYKVSQQTGLSQSLLMHLEHLKSGRKVHAGTIERLANFYLVRMEFLLGPPDEEEAHVA